VLLGSLSKTLSPALGIGWTVTPPAWVEPFRAATGRLAGPSTLDQLAFAAFLQAGDHDRHLRAARKRYRQRRDRLGPGPDRPLARGRPPRAGARGRGRGASRPPASSAGPPACTCWSSSRAGWTAPRWSAGPRPAACGS